MQAVWVDVLSVKLIISCQVSQSALQSLRLCVWMNCMQNVQSIDPETRDRYSAWLILVLSWSWVWFVHLLFSLRGCFIVLCSFNIFTWEDTVEEKYLGYQIFASLMRVSLSFFCPLPWCRIVGGRCMYRYSNYFLSWHSWCSKDKSHLINPQT